MKPTQDPFPHRTAVQSERVHPKWCFNDNWLGTITGCECSEFNPWIHHPRGNTANLGRRVDRATLGFNWQWSPCSVDRCVVCGVTLSTKAPIIASIIDVRPSSGVKQVSASFILLLYNTAHNYTCFFLLLMVNTVWYKCTLSCSNGCQTICVRFPSECTYCIALNSESGFIFALSTSLRIRSPNFSRNPPQVMVKEDWLFGKKTVTITSSSWANIKHIIVYINLFNTVETN